MIKNIAEFMTEETGKYFSKLGLAKNNEEFTTASEFSDLFPIVMADWVIQKWKKNSSPNPVQLVELGPGSGKLMKHMLIEIAKKSPDMYAALRIVMLEHTKELEEMQKEKLANEPKLESAIWISDIRELPNLPFIMLANEFFDCLPIHQVVQTEYGLRERMVDGKKFVLSNSEPDYLIPYMARDHIKSLEGSIIEVCPYAVSMLNIISEKMKATRSTLIIIDYGYEEPQTIETLQAVKNGKFYPVLETHGDADITSHVDFSALRAAALHARARVYGPIKQGIWLKRMKIEEKAKIAMENATSEDEKRQIQESVQKLVSFNKMGNTFKVMVMSSRF